MHDLSVGIPPEQLPAIPTAATDPLVQLNAAQIKTIAGLEHQLSVKREQILSFFRIVGEANIPAEATF